MVSVASKRPQPPQAEPSPEPAKRRSRSGLQKVPLGKVPETELNTPYTPEMLSTLGMDPTANPVVRAVLSQIRERHREGVTYPSPAEFAQKLSGGKFLRPAHIQFLDTALAKLREGNQRLLVMMPPRHGKSELISYYTPAWFLNEFPDKRVILASYEADFAANWGRRVRNLIQDNTESLRVRVSPDSAAANRWNTTAGGAMFTAGAGGPVTGRGGELIVIDDPVKNAEEAQSQSRRSAIMEWFNSTLYTRLEPGGSLIVVMTRWHQDDLVGRLLLEMEQGGEQWDVIKFPAIAETADELGRVPGEALWPERYDESALERIKTRNLYWWSALYQQTPILSEGAFFNRQNFEVVEAMPAGLTWVRFWDMAATDPKRGGDPDYLAGALCAIDSDTNLWVKDIVHFRGGPADVEKVIVQTAKTDGKYVEIFFEEEPGSAGKALIDNYKRTILKDYSVKVLRSGSRGSKVALATPLAAQADAGNVKLLNRHWVKPFLDECEAFPYGTHDDMVDAVSSAYYVLTGSAWRGAAKRGRVSAGYLDALESQMVDCECGEKVYAPYDEERFDCPFCGRGLTR